MKEFYVNLVYFLIKINDYLIKMSINILLIIININILFIYSIDCNLK